MFGYSAMPDVNKRSAGNSAPNSKISGQTYDKRRPHPDQQATLILAAKYINMLNLSYSTFTMIPSYATQGRAHDTCLEADPALQRVTHTYRIQFVH